MTHAFVARNTDELTLAVGAEIHVLQSPAGGWWEGCVDGKVLNLLINCIASLPTPLFALNRASFSVPFLSCCAFTPRRVGFHRTTWPVALLPPLPLPPLPPLPQPLPRSSLAPLWRTS